jgi:hypothetical protein
MFAQVFNETKTRFVFQIRGLQLADDGLRFYIKPADGMALPAIMKWLKQVFAQRYNRAKGRIGHIWGDRYGSRILTGEPPELPVVGITEARVKPRYRETPLHPLLQSLFLLPLTPAPG